MTSYGIILTSDAPRWHHYLALKFVPSLRRAMVHRDKLINDKLHEAWEAFYDGTGSNTSDKIRCVVDMIVERESILAKKQGRTPDRNSRVMFDEMAGFLNAGFETTSNALRWGIKYVTKYQGVQETLRAALREVPYLEAFMEEAMRFSALVSANIRVATTDAEVLGYRVPKGTDVGMLTNGPSYCSPAFQIDENKRSPSSRDFKGDYDRWGNHGDLDQFPPKRWLRENESGATESDSRAAPTHIFGAGVRSCYGKKLACLELRVIYTLLVWNFQLESIPDTLLDFKARDVITHTPQNVNERLREVK